ncbi:MAG: hypothetical protein ABUT20_02640 [Bacteroidota bacterium]
MKQYLKKISLPSTNIFATRLLIFASLLFTLILAITLLSFSAKKYTDEFWNQLGISQQMGDESIRESFLQGYLYNYGAKSAKNIAAGNRAAVTKDLLTYTKQYVNSDAFKKEYEKRRLGAKPIEPQKKVAKTKDEIRKERIDETKKAIDDLEKKMSTFTPDVKKIMEGVLVTQKQQLKDYQDPNSQMIDIMAQGEKMSVENDLKNYEENVKKWEEEYPAGPNGFIKKRLQQYLDIVNTVDFTAALKDVNGKKKFVNDSYERKSNDWKKVYRAGKEVNDVAKPFAGAWVKEL